MFENAGNHIWNEFRRIAETADVAEETDTIQTEQRNEIRIRSAHERDGGRIAFEGTRCVGEDGPAIS